MANKLDRRQVLARGAALLSVGLVPAAFASPAEVELELAGLFGDRLIQAGRVTLKVPPIVENGYSVPLAVEVDSPMTAEDYVRRIVLFAEENPQPNIARFTLGPRAGRASIQTRIRLGGSQTIRAIAELSDGSLWSTQTFSIVTLAACVIQ
ncbi:MAG: SoxY-related AACIE arm protein [Halieaceae bacterium]|jgi:sulfur-oxidizing protein SoxY|nr:SoxY-related AACIE arm protein [Halieaceae bacterium]